MAETDILNPLRGWSKELGCNPNWNYGWVRKTATNKKQAQPRLGRRYSRELMNAGYSATLNFIDQPYQQVQRLKYFYEQFKNGYFTLIDWDGGGRHHVGNFTTEPNEVQTANGKWTIQNLVFEEAPQARMVTYPSDFTKSSHKIFAVDDYLNPLVAYSGAGWNAQLQPGIATNVPMSYELYSPTTVAGNYAQIQYVGWGFQMHFRIGTGLGQFQLYLDGSLIATIDQSVGALTGALPPGVTFGAETHFGIGGEFTLPGSGLMTVLQVPLDAHRIKMVATGVAGSVGGGTALAFPAVQVIH